LEILGGGQFHFVTANVEKATAFVRQKGMKGTLNINGVQLLKERALTKI